MALYKAPIEIKPNVLQNLHSLKPGLIMFYAHWCPHCQHMVGTWKQLHKKHCGQHSVLAINCAADSNQAICRQFNVQGYPTIKVLRNGKLSEYTGSRDFASLERELKKFALMSGGGGGCKKCTHKTADGSQCKRNASKGKRRCWQH